MMTRIGKKQKVSTASQISTRSLEMKTRTTSNQIYAKMENNAVIQNTGNCAILKNDSYILK